jgi:Uma2 family endonuclease
MSSASSYSPLPHLATFADLLAVPEDERFHEILDGELVKKAAPSFDHGSSQCRLAARLDGFNGRPNGPARPGGWFFGTEVEIELTPHQVVRPDLAGWRRARTPERPTYPVRIRPDWVCEVGTDGDARRRDGLKKRRIYADAGVPHYWLLDTERQLLLVLRLEAHGYVEVLQVPREPRVRAEPFESLELLVGVLFGDDFESSDL